MPRRPPTLYFDFVDPLSYLANREVDRLEPALHAEVARVGFELRAPPSTLTSRDDSLWVPRWQEARAHAPDVSFDPPLLVPWTRKAHELHLFAVERGVGAEARRAVFEAFLLEGRDIGRVDELVAIGASLGLDRTETKAVLDVDRFQEAVLNARREAESLGVTTVPSIKGRDASARGFHNPADVGTLLGAP